MMVYTVQFNGRDWSVRDGDQWHVRFREKEQAIAGAKWRASTADSEVQVYDENGALEQTIKIAAGSAHTGIKPIHPKTIPLT